MVNQRKRRRKELLKEDMISNEVIKILEENKDAKQATIMAAYMQDNFVFAGIKKPKLVELIKPMLKSTAKENIDWDAIFELWDNKYREAQYVALEYLKKHRKQMINSDIEKLKRLIVNKSWWETVDTIDAFVGDLVQQDISLKDTMLEWAIDENIWLRRVAIDFQQEYKEKTDAELLEKIIVLNLGTEEFFINKAIGWSLRDYSKINPSWVFDFIDRYGSRMSKLSVTEASKNLTGKSSRTMVQKSRP